MYIILIAATVAASVFRFVAYGGFLYRSYGISYGRKTLVAAFNAVVAASGMGIAAFPRDYMQKPPNRASTNARSV